MKDKIYTKCECGGKLIGVNDMVYYTSPLEVKVECSVCKKQSYVFVDDNGEYLEKQSLLGLMENI